MTTPETLPVVDDESSTELSKPSKQNRLTKKQWLDACAMWGSGNYTLEEISLKHGVSKTALHQRFKRNGIKKNQDEERHQEAVRKALAKQEVEVAGELAKEGLQGKLLLVKGANRLMKLVLGEVQKAAEIKDQPFFTRHPNIRALNESLSALSKGGAILDTVLDFQKPKELEEDDLPILRVETLSEDDIKQMREDQRKQDAILNGDDFEEEEDIVLIDDDEEPAGDTNEPG